MKNGIWVKIPSIDMNCFGCGPDNHHGLKMTFESNGEQLRSSVTVPDHLRGWSNIVHGGVLSTISDEIMAWAAIHLIKRFILTKSITTTFLKPVFIGATLETYGYIKERLDDKNVVMACKIFNEKKEICVKAIGIFALFTPQEFEKFDIIPRDLLEKMAGVSNQRFEL